MYRRLTDLLKYSQLAFLTIFITGLWEGVIDDPSQCIFFKCCWRGQSPILGGRPFPPNTLAEYILTICISVARVWQQTSLFRIGNSDAALISQSKRTRLKAHRAVTKRIIDGCVFMDRSEVAAAHTDLLYCDSI